MDTVRSDPSLRAPTNRRTLRVLGIAVLGVALAYPLVMVAFIVLFMWGVIGVPLVSDALVWGYQARWAWVAVVAAPVAVAAIARSRRPRRPGPTNDRGDHVEPVRSLWPIVVLQLVVVPIAVLLAREGTHLAPAFHPASQAGGLELVSPVRVLWLMILLEGTAFAIAALLRDKRRRFLGIIGSVLTVLWVVVILLPTAAVATCTQLIPDEVVQPAPPGATIVRDEQKGAGWIHDPPWLRTQVLQSAEDEPWDVFGHRVARHYGEQGWPIDPSRFNGPDEYVSYARDGMWTLTVRAKPGSDLTVEWSRSAGWCGDI